MFIIIPGAFNAQVGVPGGGQQGQVVTVGSILRVIERDRRPYPTDVGTPSDIWIDNTSGIGYICKEFDTGHGTVWDRLDLLGDFVTFGDDDPGVNIDIKLGYRPGSLRYSRNSEILWICKDNTQGAAVWDVLSSGGSVVSVNGLTGVVQLYLDDLMDVRATTPTDGDVLTWDSASSTWIAAAPTSTVTLVASQGLKLNPSDPYDVQLGSATDDGSATITVPRFINTNDFGSLIFQGLLYNPTGRGIIHVDNAYPTLSTPGGSQTAISGWSTGYGISGYSYGQDVESAGVYAQASYKYAVFAKSQRGVAIRSIALDNLAFEMQRSAGISQQASVVEMGSYLRETTNAFGLNGVGMKFTYYIAGGQSTLKAHEIVHKWTEITPTLASSQYEIWGTNLSTLQQHFTLKGTGQLQLNNYGKATKAFPGTTKWFLTVDDQGNVIEVNAPTGTGDVSGSGTATRVAYWTSTTAIGDDSLFNWDNTNKALAIGATASPSSAARLYLFSSTNNADVFIESFYNQRLKFKNTTTGIQWHTSTNTFGAIDSYNIGQSSNPALGYLEILKSGRVKIGANIAGTDGYTDTTMLELGLTGVRGGQMVLNALTSGSITLKATDTTTPYTFTFPDKPSAADLFLKTDASGNTSWATVSSGGLEYAIASGTNTYAVTIAGVTAYTDGDIYSIKFTNGNTASSTITINGITPAQHLHKSVSTSLASGDIISGQVLIIQYDGSNFQVIGIAGGTGNLPAGGTAGQILEKIDSANYNVQWANNVSSIQHIQQNVKNNQGVPVSKGQAVYIDGADGTNATIKLAQADTELTSSKTLGLLEQDLNNNAKGFVITEGLLSGLDTSAATADGDPVWLSPTTPGGLVYGFPAKPSAPSHLVFIGIVIRKNANNGEIYVKVQNGFELKELHDVQAQSPALKDTLYFDNAVTPNQWKTAQASTLLPTSYSQGSAGVIFDGAGGVIATNTVAYAQIPYSGNITGGQIVANAIGSCTITVRKGTFPPSGAAIVTAVLSGSNTAPVTVSPVVAVTANEWLSFTISGVSTVAWVNLTLSITKT